MKLTFEIQGYSITIDETEEGITVAASKDDETVEEFTLELGEEMGEEDGLEGQELPEDGLEGQELPEDGGEEVPEEEFTPAQGQGQLESFTSFLKKRG